MKTTTPILLGCALALALVSCNRESLDTSNGNSTALEVRAGVSTATRASGTTWSASDQIGITAVTSPLSDTYQNALYTLSDGGDTDYGHFSATGDDVIYFTDATEISFTAYCPYQSSDDTATLPGSDGTVTVSAETMGTQTSSQEPIDFLFASAQTASEDSPTVDFVFTHQMSKIIVNVYPGEEDYRSTVAAASYTLVGLAKAGTFTVTDGTAASTGTAENWNISTLWPSTTSSTEGDPCITFTGIVFPQAPTQGDFKFSADDLSLAAELHVPTQTEYTDNESGGFRSGYAVTYDITVYEKSLVVGSTGVGNGSTITDWDAPSGSSDDYSVDLGK